MAEPVAIVEEQNRVLRITVDPVGDGLTVDWPLQDGRNRLLSQTDPVDHMLALIHDPGPAPKGQVIAGPDIGPEEWKRAVELHFAYFPLIAALRLSRNDGVLRAARRIRTLRRNGVPAVFLKAAKRGERGIIDKSLAPYLERVRFFSPTKIGVDTFTDLAAWSLHQAIIRGGYTVRRCEVCGLPFLSSGGARNCRRQAPHRKQRCMDVAKVRNFRARKGETT